MVGWAEVALGDLCEVLDRRRVPVTRKDRVAGPYPYYGASGVLDHVAGYLFDEPLVLVGEDGAKWGPGERSAFMVDGRYWVNNHAHVLRPRRVVVLDPWLVYYLNASDLTPYVSGLTVPKLNQANLREVPVPLPPLEEQKRIVGTLDQALVSVALVRANTEQNIRSARELLNSHLAATLNREGDAWPKRRLGDLCQIARGGSPRPIEKYLTSSPDGINWVKISDATASGKYISATEQKIIPEGARRSRVVHKGDFVLSNSMSFGRPYIMDTTGCIHDGWLVLSEYAHELDQDYLYYVLGSQSVYRQFDRLAAGATVRNLNIDLARRVEIPVPPLERQREIASHIEAITTEVGHLSSVSERKRVELDAFMQSLSVEAFAGAL
jgi:type I restriction enzyme S subunit